MIKKIISRTGMKEPVKALVSKARRVALSLSETSPATGRLFFTSGGQFDDEFRALASGQALFPDNASRGDRGTNYFLRRAIHRLEKGLIMRPRKPSFAADYIVDTVVSLRDSAPTLNLAEQQWAHDVLVEYFGVVEKRGAIAEAAEIFTAVRPELAAAGNKIDSVPATRAESQNLPLFDELLSLLQYRKSTRWFKQTPVPRELLGKAITAAALAPTACNRQAYYYWVFDDPALTQELVKLPMGVSGFGHNIPVLIAVVGRYRAYSHVRDRHLIYIDASLSIMAFVQALETLGLASCTINWPEIPEREKRARLAIPLESDERIVMFIAVGYPDDTGLVPHSPKQPAAVFGRFNLES